VAAGARRRGFAVAELKALPAAAYQQLPGGKIICSGTT
jgi:hypothetical protein